MRKSRSSAGYSVLTADFTDGRAASDARQRASFGLSGQNAEFADFVEHIEITEHRPKDRIDERKRLAVEPRRSRDTRLKPHKARFELCCLGLEGGFIGRRIEARQYR